MSDKVADFKSIELDYKDMEKIDQIIIDIVDGYEIRGLILGPEDLNKVKKAIIYYIQTIDQDQIFADAE